MERNIVRFGGGHGDQHTTDAGFEQNACNIMIALYSDDESLIEEVLSEHKISLLYREFDNLIIGKIDNEWFRIKETNDAEVDVKQIHLTDYIKMRDNIHYLC